MDAHELLCEIRRFGCSIRVDGDKLWVSGNFDRAAVVKHRDELIDILLREESDALESAPKIPAAAAKAMWDGFSRWNAELKSLGKKQRAEAREAAKSKKGRRRHKPSGADFLPKNSDRPAGLSE